MIQEELKIIKLGKFNDNEELLKEITIKLQNLTITKSTSKENKKFSREINPLSKDNTKIWKF